MSSKRILVVTMAFLVVMLASFAGAQTKKDETAAKSATAAEDKAPRLTIVEPVINHTGKVSWKRVRLRKGISTLSTNDSAPDYFQGSRSDCAGRPRVRRP